MYHCDTDCEVMCVWKKNIKNGENRWGCTIKCTELFQCWSSPPYLFIYFVCVWCVYVRVLMCMCIRVYEYVNMWGTQIISTVLVYHFLPYWLFCCCCYFFFLEAGFLTEDGVQQLVQLAGQWYVYLSLPSPGIPDMHQHAQHFSWVLEIFLVLGPHICINLNYHFLCILFWWMASLDSQTKIPSLILLFFLSFSITYSPFLGDYFWTPVYSKSVLSCTYFCHKPGAEYF